jgi:hypothetical protein
VRVPSAPVPLWVKQKFAGWVPMRFAKVQSFGASIHRSHEKGSRAYQSGGRNPSGHSIRFDPENIFETLGIHDANRILRSLGFARWGRLRSPLTRDSRRFAAGNGDRLNGFVDSCRCLFLGGA